MKFMRSCFIYSLTDIIHITDVIPPVLQGVNDKKKTKKNLKGFCEVTNLNDWSCSFQAHKILQAFLSLLFNSFRLVSFLSWVTHCITKKKSFFVKLITQTT